MRNGMFVWSGIAALPLVRVAVLGVAGLAPLFADLTNDIVVVTSSAACATCGSGVFIRAFGTTSTGGFNSSGGLDSAKTAWFPDHFGEFARGALNSTGAAQSAGGYTYSGTIESILIPPQHGMLQGDTGTFQLFYHLDGTVTIDVGQTFDAQGDLLSGGDVGLSWGWGASAYPTVTTDHLLAQEEWAGNKVSAVVNQDLSASFTFHYGELFYYANAVSVVAFAGSRAAPSEGFAEGDFYHTGMLTGVTVFDKNGNPIANPVVLSDSGFDYVHPQGLVSEVPEPRSAVPLGGCVGGLLLALHLRKSRRSALRAPVD